jgi:hypothetical protein
MMISMAAAGFASTYLDPRTIGAVAGVLSSSTALVWIAADWKGRLKEPAQLGVDSEEIEVHGEPAI